MESKPAASACRASVRTASGLALGPLIAELSTQPKVTAMSHLHPRCGGSVPDAADAAAFLARARHAARGMLAFSSTLDGGWGHDGHQGTSLRATVQSFAGDARPGEPLLSPSQREARS